jgi:hypothetical protein
MNEIFSDKKFIVAASTPIKNYEDIYLIVFI